MSLGKIFRNYTNGYIVEYVPLDVSGNVVNYCRTWLLATEVLWSKDVRICLYLYSLTTCFIGVAIGSDVFMTSIAVSRWLVNLVHQQ